MAQQYGLGRGLASLIPPKKKTADTAGSSPFHTASVPRVHPVSASPASHPGGPASQTLVAPTVPDRLHGEALEIPLEKIAPNPHQPRLHFDETKLDELAQSIQEHGILQPLVVSQVGDRYEIIAGERRFQAAKRAGLNTVPVVVRSATDQEKLELAIIENIQRHNLNPIEEAKAYLRLLDEFGMHQEAVAKKMGKSRSAVANTLRLLHLPIEIQRAVAEGKISEGHAKALLAIENPEKQRAVFELIIKEELTVRETEMKVRSVSVKTHTRSTMTLHPDIIRRTERLTQILGTKVRIAPSGKGGRVVIEYYAPEDLDNLLKRLEE
ncbi:MAG: ParB/RepB/Spo0J family partition protein [Candidatus Moraniibacteriota bacterium]